jgi:hypothetical protein
MNKQLRERIGIAKGKSHEIKRFWPMIGPWIASNELHKHSHVPVVDDESTTWFIVYKKGGRNVPDKDTVLAFCCIQLLGSKARLRHHFVKEPRYHSLLFKVRADYLKQHCAELDQEIVTRDERDIELVKRDGFKQARSSGSYRVYRKRAPTTDAKVQQG